MSKWEDQIQEFLNESSTVCTENTSCHLEPTFISAFRVFLKIQWLVGQQWVIKTGWLPVKPAADAGNESGKLRELATAETGEVNTGVPVIASSTHTHTWTLLVQKPPTTHLHNIQGEFSKAYKKIPFTTQNTYVEKIDGTLSLKEKTYKGH